jgi:preprotein translocase subunit SecB
VSLTTTLGQTTSDLFDWTGVNFNSDVEFGWGDGQGEDLRAYVMRLRLKITCEEGKPAPYRVDLETVGYFELIGEIKKSDREDIAKVNGASLLYGVLREILFSITARYPKGSLVLPSVNFHDLRSSIKQTPTIAFTTAATTTTVQQSTPATSPDASTRA